MKHVRSELGAQIQISFQGEYFSASNSVPLHYHPSIGPIWLEYYWKSCKIVSNNNQNNEKNTLPGLDLSGVPGSRISGTGTCTSPWGLPGGDNFCPTPTGLSALSPSPNVSLYKQKYNKSITLENQLATCT